MVDHTQRRLGSGPDFPPIGLIENERVFLPLQRGLVAPVLFQAVKIFQEEKPGGLFRVVEFGGATGLAPQNVIDRFESLLEHGDLNP